MEIFDAVVEECAKFDIMVILNVHVNTAGWCCDQFDEDGLWSTREFNTDAWLSAIEGMTIRYKKNTNVIGFDIKNELHDFNGTYLTYGTTSDNNTDWKVASELAAAIIQVRNHEVIYIYIMPSLHDLLF